MKRLFCLLLSLTLLFPAVGAVATSLPRIVDRAELLTEDEADRLEDKARTLTDTYQMDVVILTVHSLDGKSSEEFADDYFDEKGYGISDQYSGILLLLSMEYRDWAISTSGEAIFALTDGNTQQVFSEIAEYLSQDRYYDAFDAYLDALEPYLYAYAQGAPLDDPLNGHDGPGTFIPGTHEDTVYHTRKDASWYGKRIGIGLVIGLVCALIVLLVMRAQMNTAKAQRSASSYVTGGSPQITRRQDIFLYSQVRKVKKQETDSGGGSSVHRSSSGRSHGGGHGKF